MTDPTFLLGLQNQILDNSQKQILQLKMATACPSTSNFDPILYAS